MSLPLERARYVTREEYLAALGAESPQEALEALATKEFTPRLLKLAEESPRDLARVLAELERYHAAVLREVVEGARGNKAVLIADATVGTYSLALALLAHQSGLRPVSYVSVPQLSPEGLLAGTERPPNPLMGALAGKLLKRYRSAGKLRPEDLARTLDTILQLARTLGSYHEYLVLGFLYDVILLRMCRISGLEGAEFRPLLLLAQELRGVCELSLADPLSVVGALKRVHPSVATVAEAVRDSMTLVESVEAFDLAAVLASAHLASLVLYAGSASPLKRYLFYLRQLVLLRLVLSLSGDPLARSRLKSVVERWVRP